MADGAAHRGVPWRAAFLLVPNFSLIAFTSAVEALRLANYVTGREDFAWSLYSPEGEPIRASNGVALAVDGGYGDIGTPATALVCAGLDPQKVDDAALAPALRKLAARGSALGALCTGTWLLARAGLLDGHRCTIHWENIDAFREEFPGIEATPELYEIDRQRYTCGGGTAAIDMMLALVAEREGPGVAALVTDEMLHHRMRDAHEGQRMQLRERLGVAHPKLLAAITAMDGEVEHPLSTVALAARVELSARQLERLFRRYLGMTPSDYYRALRLNRARHLLRQTSMPILSVGLACGFVSASHFSKCYANQFRRTPSDERLGAAALPVTVAEMSGRPARTAAQARKGGRG